MLLPFANREVVTGSTKLRQIIWGGNFIMWEIFSSFNVRWDISSFTDADINPFWIFGVTEYLMWSMEVFPPEGHFRALYAQLYLICIHLVNDLQDTWCIFNVIWFYLFFFCLGIKVEEKAPIASHTQLWQYIQIIQRLSSHTVWQIRLIATAVVRT